MIDLSGLPFLDGHMHPPYRAHPADLAAYRWPWYEGSPDDTEMVPDTAAYRWAIRELAGDLGCAVREEDVIAAVRTREPAAWLAECVERENVVGLVADMGYPPPDISFTADELAGASGIAVAPLLRIEHRAGVLAAQCRTFDEFLDRYDAELAGARDSGYAGLKSVLAYRSGLAAAPATATEARRAFERSRAAAAEDAQALFLTEKHLLDFLFARALRAARDADMAVQIHAGWGDRDLDLPGSNPWLLRALLDASPDARAVPLVLLHGSYPYTGEAAVLAATHANIYFDVSTCVPPFAWALQMEVWRTALSMVPLSRIHASSDAAGLSEQIALGARQARRTLGVALAELCTTGALGHREAEAVAADILAGTARQLYLG